MRQHSPPDIPPWIIWVQVSMFAILYAVWALPETILIRHICLIVGALLGVYELYQFRALLKTKYAISVWLVLGIFIWATFHLLFLSNNFALQFEEFSSIWKRTVLGAIFASGLGLAIVSQSPSQQRTYWPLFYLGLLAPSLIYVIKYVLTLYGQQWGAIIPEYLKLSPGSSPFYLPKTAYVCFCLPALAVALGQLRRNIDHHLWFSWSNIIYALTAPLVLFVFYGENIKNGVVYSAFLIIVFLALLLLADFKRHWVQKMALIVGVLLAGTFFLVSHIQKNESWRTLASDAKVATNTEQFDQWKFNGTHGYPNNEIGKMVSITNYERIAWGTAGVGLLVQNPLGYGLIERSFGHLSKKVWPDSLLHQSHSGWLDLALGLGFPGITLVLAALILAMRQIQQLLRVKKDASIPKTSQAPWLSAAWWILLASLIMWCTTEISQKVFFDSLIFWIALGSSLALSAQYHQVSGTDELVP